MFFKFTGLDGSEVGSEASIWPSPLYLCSVCYKPRQCIKKQRHHKGLNSQTYGLSSSHVQMWELDHKKAWVLKNWCFWVVVLEKTLGNPSDSKGIKPVNPKGNQPWIFTERTDSETEVPIFLPPDAKHQLIWKDPDAGKYWRQKKKEVVEDDMVR